MLWENEPLVEVGDLGWGEYVGNIKTCKFQMGSERWTRAKDHTAKHTMHRREAIGRNSRTNLSDRKTEKTDRRNGRMEVVSVVARKL